MMGETGGNEGRPAAGMVVIGNEILTVKVTDSNSPFVCRELNFLGFSEAPLRTKDHLDFLEKFEAVALKS